MAKKVDFVKSLSGLSEADLKAKIQEDELRLKNFHLLMQFLHWRIRKVYVR